MSFDCVVFKEGQEPFIHPVVSETANFEVHDLDRKVYEAFSISRIEEVDPQTGRNALFIVANKIGVDRGVISDVIASLRPRPVRFFD
ncbi:hypothetical protein [Rahnella aceris]|jgi:hypothetical protein|uniref:hypothetical protein n=1 Tax=Rahnella sp. (strain Y9602) TaxID=2703885 RepID=UPI000DC24B06|nr:hypothetical protein [Rahnella aceris]UNK54123.1 hypothetical protein MNO10_04725 [Rahnella aceris]